jgi:chromate transporter
MAALLAPAMGLMWLISGQYESYRDDHRAQRFLAGVNPAVTGLILSAAVLLGDSAIGSWRGSIFCGVSLLLLRKFRWRPAFVLAIGSVADYAGVLP